MDNGFLMSLLDNIARFRASGHDLELACISALVTVTTGIGSPSQW